MSLGKKRIIFSHQRDAMDCGPTCLAMIATYCKQHPDIERIRRNCPSGKNGISLLGVDRAAKKIGFDTVAGCLGVKRLVQGSPFPCILHWNQNHFVVLYKVKKSKTFYIADPGKGLVKYELEEFKKHWISTQSGGEEKGLSLIHI